MGLRKNNKNYTFVRMGRDSTIDNKPFMFKLYEKPEGKTKFEHTESYPELDGYIEDVKHEEVTFDDGVTSQIIMYIVDSEDTDNTIKLQTSFNNVSRNMLNTLSGIDNFDGLFNFKLYMKEAKNGKSYPNIFITCDGEKTSWKYQMDDIPKPKEVKLNGKLQYDFTEQDEFFKTLIDEEIKPKLSESSLNKESKKEVVETKQTTPVDTTASSVGSKEPEMFNDDDDDDDELPF